MKRCLVSISLLFAIFSIHYSIEAENVYLKSLLALSGGVCIAIYTICVYKKGEDE